MKTSRIKFVSLFVLGAFVFVTGSSWLLNEPAESIFGSGSAAALILSPVKMILFGPLLPFIKFLHQDPDTPPPFFLAGFALYWTLLALGIWQFKAFLRTKKTP
jgi:hypothetical protein